MSKNRINLDDLMKGDDDDKKDEKPDMEGVVIGPFPGSMLGLLGLLGGIFSAAEEATEEAKDKAKKDIPKDAASLLEMLTGKKEKPKKEEEGNNPLSDILLLQAKKSSSAVPLMMLMGTETNARFYSNIACIFAILSMATTDQIAELHKIAHAYVDKCEKEGAKNFSPLTGEGEEDEKNETPKEQPRPCDLN